MQGKAAAGVDAIQYIAKNTNIWLEITTLVVPAENDSDDELKAAADFIVNQAGPDVPWHVSRFYPNYQLNDRDATPVDTLQRAEQIGKEAGLHYIYIGNVPGAKAESTFCWKCKKALIKRIGYTIAENHINSGSRCPYCGEKIAGFALAGKNS